MNVKNKRQPLLYIHQPDLSFPQTSMQTSFSSKQPAVEEEEKAAAQLNIDEMAEKAEASAIEEKAKDEVIEEKKAEEIQNKADLASYGTEAKVQEVISEFEKVQNNERKGLQRIKKFKEMNKLERIDYLLHFPKQLPPVPCVFISEGEEVRGFIVSSENDEIKVRTLDGNIQTIDLQLLKTIKMIGFR